MQHKKPLIITGALVGAMMALVFLMHKTGDSRGNYINAYNYTVNHSTPMYVTANTFTSFISSDDATQDSGVLADQTLPGLNNSGYTGPSTVPTDWITLYYEVHDAMRLQGIDYKQAATTVQFAGTTYDGVFADCSGYVGFCLYLYGKTDKVHPITSGSYNKYDNFGCVLIDKRNGLLQGDIVFYSGHVEIYDDTRSTDGALLVHNRGGTESCIQYAAPTKSSHTYNDIIAVWRIQ